MKNPKSTGELQISQNEKTGEMIVQFRGKKITMDKAFFNEFVSEQTVIAEYIGFYSIPDIKEKRSERSVEKYLKLAKDGNMERLQKEIQALQEAQARLQAQSTAPQA